MRKLLLVAAIVLAAVAPAFVFTASARQGSGWAVNPAADTTVPGSSGRECGPNVLETGRTGTVRGRPDARRPRSGGTFGIRRNVRDVP